MGDGIPKANFTIVDVKKNEVIVTGDYSSTETYDVLPKAKISFNKHKLSKKYSKENYFFINKSKLVKILFFLLALLLVFVFIKKVRKKNKFI